MTSVQHIIRPTSEFERGRSAARLAAVARAQHDTKEIIVALEMSFGPTLAYPLTRHALALLDAADVLAKRAAGEL